jgi:hypothetical protein
LSDTIAPLAAALSTVLYINPLDGLLRIPKFGRGSSDDGGGGRDVRFSLFTRPPIKLGGVEHNMPRVLGQTNCAAFLLGLDPQAGYERRWQLRMKRLVLSDRGSIPHTHIARKGEVKRNEEL